MPISEDSGSETETGLQIRLVTGERAGVKASSLETATSSSNSSIDLDWGSTTGAERVLFLSNVGKEGRTAPSAGATAAASIGGATGAAAETTLAQDPPTTREVRVRSAAMPAEEEAVSEGSQESWRRRSLLPRALNPEWKLPSPRRRRAQ